MVILPSRDIFLACLNSLQNGSEKKKIVLYIFG
jgi:hypothetical protein